MTQKYSNCQETMQFDQNVHYPFVHPEERSEEDYCNSVALQLSVGKFGDKVSVLKLLYHHVVKGNLLHFQG